MKNFKPSVVALDTNAFITMAALDVDFDSKHGVKIGFKQSCRDIKRMARNGHIKFVITPTAFAEIANGLKEKEKDFLQNYCYIYTPENPKEFALDVYNLAVQYMQTDTMRSEGGRPTKDALIMAESTILGLSLISNNVKDFKDYDRYRKEKKGKRKLDIMHVNDRMGYSYEIDGQKIVPAPQTSFEYLQLFRDGIFIAHENMYNALDNAYKCEILQQIEGLMVKVWDCFYVQILNA